MSAYTEILKQLMRKRRQIIDHYRQASDGTAAQKKAAEARARPELEKVDGDIAKVKSQMDAVTPESLEWGPDASRQHLDEMINRYPASRDPRQGELPLKGGVQSEIPWNQIDESLYNTDPSTWRRGSKADRAAPGVDPRQRDLFEPGITQGGTRQGFPIEDDVWGFSRLTPEEMRKEYSLLQQKSNQLEQSYKAGEIPRLKETPHGDSYDDSRSRLDSALQDIEYRMQESAQTQRMRGHDEFRSRQEWEDDLKQADDSFKHQGDPRYWD